VCFFVVYKNIVYPYLYKYSKNYLILDKQCVLGEVIL